MLKLEQYLFAFASLEKLRPQNPWNYVLYDASYGMIIYNLSFLGASMIIFSLDSDPRIEFCNPFVNSGAIFCDILCRKDCLF